ncbi:hypothetical protein ABTH27_20025, partial [Acinetobacter baumannii]
FPRLLAACACALLLAGCGARDAVERQEAFVFGTRVEVGVYGLDRGQAREALAEVLQEFDRLHRRLHAWQPSELTRLNAAFGAGRTAMIDAD